MIKLTERDKTELNKLTKKYKVLKRIEAILIYYAIFMFLVLLLEEFGIIDLPFYESRLISSLRVFLNTWVGIPIVFIQKAMKKIDARISEIYSFYANRK